MSDVIIVYINHTADHLPGDAELVSADVATQLVEGNVARIATEEEATAIAEALEQAQAAEAEAETPDPDGQGDGDPAGDPPAGGGDDKPTSRRGRAAAE